MSTPYKAKLMGEEPRGYSKQSDDEEEVQLARLRAPEHCIEAQVQDGDTLQAIALRFHCSISELKRINHMTRDNEIFARRTIKVPVTPYSVLTEVLPSSPEPVHSATNGIQDKPESSGDHIIDYNAAILNSNIAPAVVPYTDGETLEQVEESTLLIQPKKRECVEAVLVKDLASHGADFGFKWYHLLSCALVLGIVIPLVCMRHVLFG